MGKNECLRIMLEDIRDTPGSYSPNVISAAAGGAVARIRELESNQQRLENFVRQVRAVAGSDGFTDRYDWCGTATELLHELEDSDG
jgi:hypothetical protein